MADFPSTECTKQFLDDSTDSPASARSELATLVDTLNDIITSYAVANGICPLDATGKISASLMPAGAGTGTDADLLDGEHGTYYTNADNLASGTLPAARFADSAHGSRSGGALHANATQTVAGFMSASDKQAVDGIDSAIAAGTTTAEIGAATSGLAVYAVGSYIMAALVSTSSGNNTLPGETITGSVLRPAGISVDTDGGSYNWSVAVYGTGLAGTWRCMGRAPNAAFNMHYVTLWLRVS